MQSLCLLLALAASAALAPVPEPGFGPASRSGDAVSLVLLLVACSVVLRSQVQVTPVQKVVQLLENMKEKGTKEMQEEEVQYTKFKQFCDMTLREKEAAIDEAADKIETLEADIEKAASEAERLGKEMSEHQADIEAATAEKEKATAVREKGRTDFQLTLKDYSESIDAIARALKALKEEDKKTALLQLADAKLLPDEARQSLLDTQGPAPKTYEFQSGGVISMLEGLQDKFVDERISLEREEQKKRHAYEMLAQSLDSQLAQSKKEQEEKGQFKAKQLQSKASSEGDLGETKVEKQSDEKYSTDLAATCSKKAAAFAARQKLRQEEIEAIEKAKGIIAGEAVAGSAGKHLPSLLQGPKRTALAFLRSEVREPQSERVARFLQQRASALNSRVLSAVAGRAAADPIAKVRTMIEQLITKMQTQQNKEASKNGWCNAELASNKATREEKTDAVDELSSDADELSTAIGKLGEEVSTLSRQVSELDADMAKATQMREEESAKNAATVKDAKEAQAAVAQALLVLRDFYKKAAGASSLAQMRGEARGEARAEPKVFGDEPYTGMGESGGVISMLEVIQSDFAQLQAETEAAEESGLKEYQDFMEDSKVDKATKVRASEHKASKKQAKAQELTAVRADLKGTQKELDAAKAYFEKLKPDCLDTGASYAERQAQRKQEAPSPAVTSLSRRPPVAPTSPHVARSLACRSESRAVAVLPPFVPRWRTSRRPSRCSRRSDGPSRDHSALCCTCSVRPKCPELALLLMPWAERDEQ